MKTIRRIITTPLLALIAAFVMQSQAKADAVWDQIQQTGKIVCGAIPNDPLGSWIDAKTNRWEGYEIDLCRAIAKDLSTTMGKTITPQFVETSWKTLVLDIQSRKIDLWPGMSATEERMKAISMIGPIYDLAFCTVNKKGGVVATKWSDLNTPAVRVATIQGTSIESAFKKFAPNATHIVLAGFSEITLAVQSGRADVMGTDALRCLSIIKSAPDILGQVVFPVPFASIGSSAGVIKSADQLTAWLTKWASDARANNVVKNIFIKVMDGAGFDTTIIPPELKF